MLYLTGINNHMPVMKLNIDGRKFGRLSLIQPSSEVLMGKKHDFMCDCGNEKTLSLSNIGSGQTKSCGCLLGINKHSFKHGLHMTKEYSVWHTMKTRCYNKNAKNYPRYGGRGIHVCDSWKSDPESFVKWCRENGYKEGLQLDRIDNNGPYSPNNCRFVEPKVNANNRGNNVRVEAFGESKTVAEWARDDRCAVGIDCLKGRFRKRSKEMSNEEKISRPVNYV